MTSPLWSGLCAGARSFGSIIRSALTGPDGVSWAPGRIMGFGVFVVGQCLVIRATAQMLHRPMDPNNWGVMFACVAGFEAAICGTAIGLVLGMAPADPFGKWWDKDAHPPPTPDSRP